MQRLATEGLFVARTQARPQMLYRIVWEDGRGTHEAYDAYAFPPTIGAVELYLFGEGRLLEAWRTLGAHPSVRDGVEGARFAVWAPNAERVSVVGDFNGWDGRLHQMRVHGGSGVWELFVPGVARGALYKYEIRARGSGTVAVKSDPYGRWFEYRPATAARVWDDRGFAWNDEAWMHARAERDWKAAPLWAYEVHLGSWRRRPDGGFLSYDEVAEPLARYVRAAGYTHVEFLPLGEHPLDESWGYQCTGYFAPTSRFGDPDGFRRLVDRLHAEGIGVLLDWVPAHFPRDEWALARYDGTALYEHEDPRAGEHPDWGTLIFNYGRNEVRSFLLSSAVHWLEEFHVDGLRVDAVASMLYLDYSRRAGEWIPNRYGGRENLEAIAFLRECNAAVHERFPGVLTIAEESTAWPQVSRPVHVGGLGFSMKWNMGWMNDTLRYFSRDPVHRRFYHDELTFSRLYAFTENFVLPLSHDEVVHGKRSLIDKMPGDAWQRFANVRLLIAWQATHPGKKLSFMGNEFAHGREWDAARALDWEELEEPHHAGVAAAARDLARLYANRPALHAADFDESGFRWIDCHDADASLLSFVRSGGGEVAVVVLNFTPVVRDGYRIGMPRAGRWREAFNGDSAWYGGSNAGNAGVVQAEAIPWMGCPYSATIVIPPLAALILVPEDAP